MRVQRGIGGAGRFAPTLGRGVLAGLAGVVAYSLSDALEQRLRGRRFDTTAGDAAAQVLGIAGAVDEAARRRLTLLVRVAMGSAWGTGLAALRGAGLAAGPAGALVLAAITGNRMLLLPALGLVDRFEDPVEAAIDVAHHLVYVGAAVIAHEAQAEAPTD